MSTLPLRRRVQEYFDWKLTDKEWLEVEDVSGAAFEPAPDEEHFERACAAVRYLPRYRDRVAMEITRLRQFLGVDKSNVALSSLLALSALESQLRARVILPSEWSEKHFNGLGKLLAASAAAYVLERRLRLPAGSCLPAIVGTAANHGALFDLLTDADRDFSAWAQGMLFGKDRRRASPLQDIQFTGAIARIVSNETNAASTAQGRWEARLTEYEKSYAPVVGRTFKNSQLPWRALRQAYREARKRVLAREPEFANHLPPP